MSSTTRLLARVISIAAVLGCNPPLVLAQTSSIRGAIVDTQDLPMPGVSLTVSSGDTRRSVTTDQRGLFVVDALPPGRYNVLAEVEGFLAETAELVVRPGAVGELTLVMTPSYLETVVVTSSRSPQSVMTAPVTVTVVPAHEIAARSTGGFAELFVGTPGLNVTRFNARDMSFDFRMAGGILSRSQLVMVDGRTLNQDGSGIMLWDFFPGGFDELKQIELIGTPGSAVWGASALTGVINVRTKAPREDLGGAATIGFGSVGVRDSRLRWSQAIGRLSYRASASYLSQDAWERDANLPDGSPLPVTAVYENRGTAQTKANVRVDWEGSPGRVWTAHLGAVDTSGIIQGSVGPNVFLNPGSYGVYGGAGYSSDPVDAQVYVSRTRGDIRSLLFGNVYYGSNFSGTGDVVVRRSIGRRQAVRLGGSATVTAFDMTLTPGDSRRSSIGGFVEDQIAITPKLTWTIGSRLDKFDSFGATLSPRTSLVYQPTSGQALHVAVNRAYRAPSLLETFARSDIENFVPIIPQLPPVVFTTSIAGNRKLDPEVMRAVELGLTTAVGSRATFSVTTYYNLLRGSVRFVEVESYGPSSPPPGWPLPTEFVPAVPKTLSWLNIGTVRDRGLELSGRAYLGNGLSTRASYSYQAAPKLVRSDSRFPLQLNRPPTHRASVGLVVDQSAWRGSFDAAYTDVAYWSDILDSRFWGTTSAYVMANARLDYRLPGRSATLGVSGTNLLNRRIKQHVFADVVPRQISAQLRVDWGRPTRSGIAERGSSR